MESRFPSEAEEGEAYDLVFADLKMEETDVDEVNFEAPPQTRWLSSRDLPLPLRFPLNHQHRNSTSAPPLRPSFPPSPFVFVRLAFLASGRPLSLFQDNFPSLLPANQQEHGFPPPNNLVVSNSLFLKPPFLILFLFSTTVTVQLVLVKLAVRRRWRRRRSVDVRFSGHSSSQDVKVWKDGL